MDLKFTNRVDPQAINDNAIEQIKAQKLAEPPELDELDDLEMVLEALEDLEERIPQLPELHCSIKLYHDGSGFVLDGLDEELGSFLEGDSIEKTINNIKPMGQ